MESEKPAKSDKQTESENPIESEKPIESKKSTGSEKSISPLVDIHTHYYSHFYFNMLYHRSEVPYVWEPPNPISTIPSNVPPPSPRLVLLPSDDLIHLPKSQRGRPFDESYFEPEAKLAFMEKHHIAHSVISLGNPWLDWAEPREAAGLAMIYNRDLERTCQYNPGKFSFFATLPIAATFIDLVVHGVELAAALPHCKGVIMGTNGRAGAGLDDAALDPVWEELAKRKMLVFIHPHYGIPPEVYGHKAAKSGHVLPLALGFPFETTIAFVRMYLAGVFDRHPQLQVLLAHAGGAVPFLAGRVESCVAHERTFVDESTGKMKEGRKGIAEVLRQNVWLDGVVYSRIGMEAAKATVGAERVLWGTDHPFFPPLGAGSADDQWLSVKTNIDAVKEAFGNDTQGADGVLGMNAINLLDLKIY